MALFIILFSILTVNAQDSQSYFAIRSGLSIPIGNYASKNLDGGSFTQPGFNVTLNGDWFFLHKFGLEALVAMNLHPVDVASLGQAKIEADPFLNDLVIRSEPYLIIISMVGPVAQLHIGDRFMFKGKILGGLLYGKTPYQLYKPDYFGVVAPWSEITSAKDWKFSWQAGMGITYQLSCVAFVFETEIIHDQLEFNFYKGSTLHTEYKDISIINTTLGIHLLF